jgi:glycerol-3-phosphate O-acyltransferase 1/2
VKPLTSLPGVFELTYYANPVAAMYACESLFATGLSSIIEHTAQEQPYKDVTVSKEELLDAVVRLAGYLHYEFVFCPPCQTMDSMLEDICEKFLNADILEINEGELESDQASEAEKQWAQRMSSSLQMSDDEDSSDEYTYIAKEFTVYKVRTSCASNKEKLGFLKQIISPLIDTYYMTAIELTRLSSEDVPEKKFVDDVHQVILQHINTGSCLYSESLSLVTINNAVQAFERLNIVERYREEGSAKYVLSLSPKYKDHQELADLVRDIETFRN